MPSAGLTDSSGIRTKHGLAAIPSLACQIAGLAYALVILVLLFRVPVRRALLSLTRLKYKDLELDFGRELKGLEKEAKAIDITPQPPKSIAPTQRDSSQLLQEAAQLAQRFP